MPGIKKSYTKGHKVQNFFSKIISNKVINEKANY